VGTYFIEELAKLRDQFETVGDVRGKGLMIGIEMVKDKVFIHLVGYPLACIGITEFVRVTSADQDQSSCQSDHGLDCLLPSHHIF
jgi:acetylornithine/succinyldiaminopimelate/putrescine aminotransferase